MSHSIQDTGENAQISHLSLAIAKTITEKLKVAA